RSRKCDGSRPGRHIRGRWYGVPGCLRRCEMLRWGRGRDAHAGRGAKLTAPLQRQGNRRVNGRVKRVRTCLLDALEPRRYLHGFLSGLSSPAVADATVTASPAAAHAAPLAFDPTAQGQVLGRVWEDSNADGVLDGG